MANFLITTANTLAEGTSTADTFYFNTARGISLRGSSGDDVLTAGTANLTATNALLAGNAGDDTINLGTAFNTNQGSIYGGSGDDLISASQFSAVDATLQGGGGDDTLTLSGSTVNRGNVGLNLGDDTVVVSGNLIANSAVIALGGGTDTFVAQSANFAGTTLNGGGGDDLINIDDGNISAGQINGDVLGDDEFFGNDTITVSGNGIGGGVTINGGLGDDVISARAGAAFGGFNTGFVNANQGNDVITVDGIGSGAQSAFIGGGAGQDTISVGQSNDSGQSFGTVMGGGGIDTITYSSDSNGLNGAFSLTNNTGGTTGGFIQGGEGADLISFNGNNSGGVATLLYASAGESNIVGNANNIDTVSSNAQSAQSFSGALVFNVGQMGSASTLVSAQGTIGGQEVYSATSNGSGGQNSGGIVTFTGTFSDNINDQVSALDVNTNQNGGAVAIFSKGTDATTYLFMQGGTAGTADDLVVKVNEDVIGASFRSGSIDIAGSAIVLNIGQLP